MIHDPLFWFVIGFVAGFVPVTAFVITYYVRARARVRLIQQHIETYQKAKRAVEQAANKVYKDLPNSPKNHNKHCSQ